MTERVERWAFLQYRRLIEAEIPAFAAEVASRLNGERLARAGLSVFPDIGNGLSIHAQWMTEGELVHIRSSYGHLPASSAWEEVSIQLEEWPHVIDFGSWGGPLWKWLWGHSERWQARWDEDETNALRDFAPFERLLFDEAAAALVATRDCWSEIETTADFALLVGDYEALGLERYLIVRSCVSLEYLDQ
ncbi:MAG: hypothetical protein AAFX85_11170, partial [Pseudomonadota bacterium]